MGIEIERKFLVAGNDWQAGADEGRSIRQAYLANGGAASVRIRVLGDRGGKSARLTIKSRGGGLSRAEFEYPVPVADALELMALRSGNVIEKTRYRVPAGPDRVWEVDVFAGVHAGLVLAEIELGAEDELFERPDWLGEEVTGDPRYANAALARA